MFTDVFTALRSAATTALQSSNYTQHVYQDALESKLFGSATRCANITIALGQSTQITCGTPARYRVQGILYVKLYEPIGVGDKVQLDAATIVAAALRSKSISKNGSLIKTKAPSLQNIPVDGNMWVKAVVVEFKADAYF